MEYKTKQKELVYDYLAKNKGRHLTVADIVDFLRASGNPVGTTTVYRYLDSLVDQGFVRKYFVDEATAACYQFIGDDAECSNHIHLKCTSCGKLIHLSCTLADKTDRHILKHHGFCVDNTKTVLYGLCKSCAERNDNR